MRKPLLIALAPLALLALALVPCAALGAAPSAYTVTVGDFTLSGDTLPAEGVDYRANGGCLSILSDKAMTVGMRPGVTETTTWQIEILTGGGGAHLTFAGVKIDVSSINYQTALYVYGGCALTLTLAHGTENSLKSGSDQAGLCVPENAALVVNGTGALTAAGGERGAGIGGYIILDSGAVTIDGGSITATGGAYGAGVGGGGAFSNSNGGDCGSVLITGGTLTATGGTGAAGIGGGGIGEDLSYFKGGDGGTVTITGGTVIATGGSGNPAGIGMGSGYDFNTATHGTLKISGGTVRAASGGRAMGAAPDLSDYAAAFQATAATNSWGNDPVDYNPAAIDEYRYINIRPNPLTAGDFTVNGVGIGAGIDYSYANGVLTILSGKPMTLGMSALGNDPEQREHTRVVVNNIPGGAFLTLDGVSIVPDNNSLDESALRIAGGTPGSIASLTLTLANGTVNTLEAFGRDDYAALNVPANARLTINGQGLLRAEANRGAGVGGNARDEHGAITLESGCFLVARSEIGAGIGGGEGSEESDRINILGSANVEAASATGAGIGGGKDGASPMYIHISNNARVTAVSTYGGAGIGGGGNGDSSNIDIAGNAVVLATGGMYGAGIGGGMGGSAVGAIEIKGNAIVIAAGAGGGAGIGAGADGTVRGAKTAANTLVAFAGGAAPGAYVFSDATGLTALPDSAYVRIIPCAAEPYIITPSPAFWQKGSADNLVLTASGDHSNFIGLGMDGALLDSALYDDASGSTVITLHPAYLNTLTVATHSLRVLYNDGYAEAPIVVRAAATASPAPATASPVPPPAPPTGDAGRPALWLALALLGGAGALALVYFRRRRRA